MTPKMADKIRMMRKALDMIEADLQADPPHVDDRDEAYWLAQGLVKKATELEDLVGNTAANDSAAFTS